MKLLHLLKNMFFLVVFSLVGFKRSSSLLDIFAHFSLGPWGPSPNGRTPRPKPKPQRGRLRSAPRGHYDAPRSARAVGESSGNTRVSDVLFFGFSRGCFFLPRRFPEGTGEKGETLNMMLLVLTAGEVVILHHTALTWPALEPRSWARFCLRPRFGLRWLPLPKPLSNKNR